MREEPTRRRPGPQRDAGDGHGGSAAGSYLGAGLQFALSIIVFVYLGQWLDRRYGTEPWLLLAGLVLGGGGGFYSLYRKLMADLRREEERRKK